MSNTYVKKYDVGQIKLDLPYANYIHELPLLSFGDVQHTVNLSLVFNYERHLEENNFFNIASGFKLNLQKRLEINTTTNIPEAFQEESGKFVKLNNNGGNIYTFDDNSQRIIRKTNYGYELENPDFSTEIYTNDGNILSILDKYNPSSNILHYRYYNNRVSSITYRSSKTISFEYEDDKLSKITYAGNEIKFSYNGNIITIEHYSGVFYKIELSDNSYRAYSTDASSSNIGVYEVKCEHLTPLTVTEKINNEIVNKSEYTFARGEVSSRMVTYFVDIKNMDGVTTRMYFSGEEPLYSHEVGLENDGFFNNQYFTGDINIYRTINSTDDERYQGVQKYEEWQSIGYEQSNNREEWGYRTLEEPIGEGYYVLSGWIKSEDNTSDTDTVSFTIASAGNHIEKLHQFNVNLYRNQQWQYFSYQFYTEHRDFDIYTTLIKNQSSVSTRDFRITVKPVELPDEQYSINMFISKDAIINETSSAEHVIPLPECRFFNGNTEISERITLSDLLRYKINQMYGTNKNEIYFDNCRGVIANAGVLNVKYGDYTVPVTSIAVGTKTFSHHITNIIKSNFYTDENNQPYFSTKYCSNGNCYKEDIYDDNLDIISSRVEGVTTTYQRNPKGLITAKTTSALGISTPITQTISYNSINSKILSTTDEFGVVTTYETDDTWGIVNKVTVNGETVLINEYDANNVALVGKSFSTGDNSRKNILGYSNGRLTSLQNKLLTYTFNNTFEDNTNDEIASVSKNSNSIEHHKYSDTDNGTTVTSKYPSDSNPLQTTVTNLDKYGRVIGVNGIYSNTYDIHPDWYYFDSNYKYYKTMDTYDRNTHGELKRGVTGIDNKDGALAQTDDLITGEKTKYGYTDNNLTAAITYDSNDSIIRHETFVYDDTNRLTKDTCIYDIANNKSVKSVIEYTHPATHPLADGKINKYSYYLNGDTSPAVETQNEFDSFNRVIAKYHFMHENEFVKDIIYDKTRPKTLYESFNGSEFSKINYRYDAMGRIIFVDNGESSTTYTYDNYGQLTKEVNLALDKTFQYVYNENGNIESVTTTPKNGSAYTTTFGYDTSVDENGNLINPDRLTAFNGTIINYDDIGCPLSYGDKTLSWENGKLIGFTSNSSTSGKTTNSYSYNAFGQRVRKEYSYLPPKSQMSSFHTRSRFTDYYYDNAGRLIAECWEENFSNFTSITSRLEFLYDESGIIGFKYIRNGVDKGVYYYQRNLQGDVVTIYDTNCNVKAVYKYDAFGNCTITNSTNDDIANINPIRYRGYYWDSETNWYFLNARYYNPEWRRFVSPDDTNYLDPESVNGLNLYCYCGNDPVNFVDPSGHSIIAALIYGGLIGFALGFGFSVAGQYVASNGDWDKVNWGMAFYDGFWGAANGVLAATSITAPLAILAGAGMGGISSIGSDLIFNNGSINWDGVIINTFLGGVAGLIAGSGSGITIDKYVHSKDILNRTIANGTTRAIGRQASAMYKHMLPLVDSGIRYILGNGIGTITSKGITVT